MSLKNDTLISVLVVLKNDRDIIDDFIQETTQILSQTCRYYEVLLIDNGSTDGTGEVVQALQKRIPNLRLLRLSRSHDTETALAAALDNSLGDYVVIMHPAYDPPAMIPVLLEQAVLGYDVVIAELRQRDAQPFLRRSLAVLFYKIASRLLRYRLQPNATHFRVFSRQVVNSLTKIGSKSRYLKYLNALVGFRQTHIQYERVYRERAASIEPGILKLAVEAVDIIISNSAVPLRLASLLGLLSSFLSLVYCVYVLLISLLKKNVAEGWITTNLMSTGLFFMMFLILTILSEYIARILEESKDRPLYFIEYETNSSVASYKEEVINRVVNVV
ncbi:MAG TPA: glycosyltransferase [Blastocatellia bacterium]|nr:glycosyltransferase [Blastocatellia bacterium]